MIIMLEGYDPHNQALLATLFTWVCVVVVAVVVRTNAPIRIRSITYVMCICMLYYMVSFVFNSIYFNTVCDRLGSRFGVFIAA